MRIPFPLLASLAALVPLSPPAAAQFDFHVFVVDDDGGAGVDATDIQSAVDLAGKLDLILVKDGSYPGFTIDTIGLTVVAEAGADVRISGLVTVQGTNSANQTLLRGLRSSCSGAPFRLHVRNAFGDTWVEDCVLGAADCPNGPGASGATNGAAVLLENMPFPALIRTVGRGHDGLAGARGHAGLRAVNVNAHMWGCTFTGGDGGDAADGQTAGGAGGSGVSSEEYSHWWSDSVMQGGAGGDGGSLPSGCANGGPGGPGLRIAELFSDVEDHALTLTGGAGGGSPCGPPGAAGPGLLQLDGLYTQVAGPVVALVANSPVRENDTVTVTVTGAPGDSVVLLASNQQLHSLDPDPGVLLVAANSRQIDLGTIPASGTIVTTFSAGTVPAPFEYANVYLQALVSSGGTTITGPGTAVSILDGQF